MRRVVTSHIDLDLTATIDLIFQIAVSTQLPSVTESLTITQHGQRYAPTELVDASGNRLHRVTASSGLITMRYQAVVTGETTERPTSELDLISYLRPSRYCQADEIFPHARRLFAGLSGMELIAAVSEFVTAGTRYTPGLSLGTDSAVTTLSQGYGVCRDFAHLVIALLRAMDVPARYAACYAPGLKPMDFHAVAEAFHQGRWHVIDATGLSDPGTLVPIATGRDAADCAFLTYHGGHLDLIDIAVDAWLDSSRQPEFPEGAPQERNRGQARA